MDFSVLHILRLLIAGLSLANLLACSSTNVVNLEGSDSTTFSDYRAAFPVSENQHRNGILHMPTGQTAHPLSDFFGRGHEDWVKGKPSPFLPGEPAHTLTLAPDRR